MPPASTAKMIPAPKATAAPKNGTPKTVKTNSPGLTLPRRYTQPGQDVWASVQWELRNASIVGSDGTVVFEQNGVEIPKDWSQLATNVVVSKYFRGQIGTLEREYSVKQLIGRVADRILEWGKQGSYFASDADADAFHDELRFILLHQYAAFNSPVWFNLGWAGRRQAVSACYINEVDDTMESILDLYKTEGMLFKDGSGSGLNLSTLRSSKEPLEAGGRSSGPISFMKGLDASAGSIKSGGSTRRAACMRVLNIDHPDVKEFIDCKKDAELKAHALIDAGYSGAFNVAGGAYDTVPFQNANHSVRVTDEFMQAVEADALWDTKFRMSGKTAETFRAKDLLHSIAEGTWVCGDPGMQYDTTANDWHTCANTDRIHASNPCVTGDTLVATSEGWQRIDSLVGQSARIIGADGQPHFVDQIFPTGHKKVFNLRTRAGFEVTITGNHQVLTTERGDVAVDDLRLGEHLHLEGAGFGRRALNETLALAIGIAVGDGCLSRQVFPGRNQEYVILTMAEAEAPILDKLAVELNHQKMILRASGLCGHPGDASVVPQSASGSSRLSVGSAPVVQLFKEFAVLDEGSSRKRFTPAVYDLDKPTLAAVLRGLFTADGTVANYGDKSQYVSLDSTSQDLLQQVQMLLLSFGIKAKIYTERRGGKTEAMLPNSARQPQSYTVQEMHSLRISKASRIIFEREIGFDAASAKSARLRDMNLAFTTYKDTLADEVVSITEAGMADVYDLTEGVTHHFVANGLVVHNCSEFFFLNSTACNLSSLNLMKFRQEDSGAFDTASFDHAVRIMITAQEIVVGFASYPTDKIERRSHEFRPLGLGYANLGALLMAAGLPYDSDAGRAYAGAVTALMTGRAYHQSALVARDCGGPFAGFAENRDPMLRVMGKHRAAVDDINPALIPDTLLDAARTAWDEALEEGEVSGYRNAQSTVLAPTGTIGFLMDCDTTGIEPDIAIVKYKSLVGGGMMKIVNQTVPEALQRLGYDEAQVEGIIKFIDEHDTIEGAPDLRPEHLPIFDCAFRPMNGTRSIHYRGHIKMMAAAQPFISGAISKTVNVPNDATPEDIAETYMEAWKLGIKAVAIYRDGSKRTQPLNTSKEAPAEKKTAQTAEAAPTMALATPKAVRRRLPDERAGLTHKFSIGGHEGYLTVGLYPDTNQPGEIFIRMSKEGSSISGLMDSFATAISLALQYGVPLSTLVDKFIHSRFEPSGFTGNKEIPMAKSVMDYIFRYLALRFLQKEDRHNVGLLADQDDAAYAAPAKLPAPPPAPAHDSKNGSLSNGNGKNGNGNGSKSGGSDLAHLAETNTATIADHEREIYRMQSDAPPCPECGAITIRNGACYRCISCGTSLGCS